MSLVTGNANFSPVRSCSEAELRDWTGQGRVSRPFGWWELCPVTWRQAGSYSQVSSFIKVVIFFFNLIEKLEKLLA